MNQWLIGAGIVGAIVLFIGYLTWLLIVLVDFYFKNKFRQAFLRDLRGAIKHSQPSWEQLVEIARSRHLNQQEAYSVASEMLRDVLTGVETELVPHRQLLEDYLAEYRTAEPFEGLPSQTRVHLERIREALGANTGLLDPLTDQIKELVSIYEKENSRQRIFTTWGVVLGAIGLLFAAYAYFVPYSPSNESKVVRTPSGEVASPSPAK